LKLTVLLTAGAAAAAFAIAAPASAAVRAPAAGGPPLHVLSLHRAYENAVPHATAPEDRRRGPAGRQTGPRGGPPGGQRSRQLRGARL